ncbi:MAG: hypothetical protein CBD88_07240 [Flavobacteriales bacterium TMED228]|nr:MAG: hypothetical protein CBD88_07240 [Flavobacteriales bacterium TMED228]
MSLQKRRCRNCRKKADGEKAIVSPVVAFCCYECLKAWNNTKAAKKARLKMDRKITREAKERLKRKNQWMREAQSAFNKFIRVRDKKFGVCVSCDVELVYQGHGGNVDASHFRPRSAAPQLRFNQYNCHASCVRCNRWMEGNLTPYRKQLIKRIGKQRVLDLENDNKPKNYTIDDLKRIKEVFKKRAKLYEKKFR